LFNGFGPAVTSSQQAACSGDVCDFS